MSRAKNQVVIYKMDGVWRATIPNTSKMCTWFVTTRTLDGYHTVHKDEVIPFLLNLTNQGATNMTYLQIQTELDAVMEKLKTLPGHCQKPEDRKVLNRMYDLVELKNKLVK